MQNLKNISILLLLAFILSAAVYAQGSRSSYNSFYIYNKERHGYYLIDYTKEDIKTLSNIELKHYKTAKKINKLYMQGRYEEIINKYPDFTPGLLEMYRKNYNTGKYDTALYYLNKISKFDKSFDKKLLSNLYFLTYYKTGKYDLALEQLSNPEEYKKFSVFIADCYLNLEQYPQAILYANKIPENGDNYYMAQTILFKAYFRQNKTDKAKNIAQKLIDLKPYLPDNYLRFARCENDKAQKIKYYYLARDRARDIDEKNDINAYVMFLEQEKLNNVIENLEMFVDKPDWIEILKTAQYGDFDYWISRQDDFFKASNNCIQKYTGKEQIKCFENLNKKQDTLTLKLIQTVKLENEKAYQEAVVRQNQELIRQQMIQNINQINAIYQMKNINNSLQEQNNQLKRLNNYLYW